MTGNSPEARPAPKPARRARRHRAHERNVTRSPRPRERRARRRGDRGDGRRRERRVDFPPVVSVLLNGHDAKGRGDRTHPDRATPSESPAMMPSGLCTEPAPHEGAQRACSASPETPSCVCRAIQAIQTGRGRPPIPAEGPSRPNLSRLERSLDCDRSPCRARQRSSVP